MPGAPYRIVQYASPDALQLHGLHSVIFSLRQPEELRWGITTRQRPTYKDLPTDLTEEQYWAKSIETLQSNTLQKLLRT